MSLINSFRSYLLEEELRVNILKNKVHIVNYTSIDHFDDNQVMVRHDSGYINIKGEKLSVTRLLNTEILIEGKVRNVEFK